MIRNSIIIFLGILVSASSLSGANSNDEAGWTETVRQSGIVGFVGPKNAQGIRPTRTTMHIEVSAEKVLTAILDIQHYPEWVPHCDSSKKMESSSDRSLYFYQVLSAPLIKDRDLVAKVEVTKLAGEYRVVLKSVPDHIATKSNKVRIQHLKSEYSIKPMADGSTQVVMLCEIDMEGIPPFLINWANEKQPYQTFSQLRQHILNS